MYAKLVNDILVEAPNYVIKDSTYVLGYNLDSNSEMLLTDGYKLVVEKEQPVEMKQPELSYKETEKTIEYVWTETYVEPTIEEQNENIRKLRQQAYVETSDSLYMDYQEALARGEATAEEKKQLWLASKDKIREENPYIEVK